MPVRPSGPCPAPILIVGEAPGEQEAMAGVPFIGPAGDELRRMLRQASIDPSTVRFTNVFSTRPPNNKIEAFCGKRAEVGKDYNLPPLSTGNYVHERYLPELVRLRAEIEECDPKLIIAVGNTPSWALIQRTGIGRLRGSVFPCELSKPRSVLPTYHPAAILRDWSLRTITVQDLIKAQRYVTTGFSVPSRQLWLEPTLDEVRAFFHRELQDRNPALLSFDVETFGGTVTCIGFSTRRESALTVPFYDPARPDRNYWPTLEDELSAYRMVKDVLESDIPKLGQNGLYDIQYCYRWGIRVRNYLHDTMIKHHSMYPELPKGLGFMASIYTDEAPWKLLRARGKGNFKQEDE